MRVHSILTAAALLLAACAPLGKGAALRRQGEPVESTEVLLAAYDAHPRKGLLKQLHLSFQEASRDLEQRYAANLSVRRLDHVREKSSRYQRDYDLLERARPILRGRLRIRRLRLVRCDPAPRR